ncbi:MAG: transcriptional repressor LexA [Spirochaetaceae bacterium]|nr:transcriptional repressor LexA [Spirochaetaceae bacterium]
MKKLTDKQLAMLNFIRSFGEENGCPPTIRECASHFSISLHAVQCHFAALQKKGYLSQPDKRSRSIRILLNDGGEPETKPAVRRVPLLGSVAAGKPLLSEENLDGHVVVSENFLHTGGNYFALRVKGDSMVEAGILDGDLAIIRQENTAENGQIVVAVLDDAITLKRFFQESCRVRLQPENSAYKPIYCQDVQVAGILAGIIRTY